MVRKNKSDIPFGAQFSPEEQGMSLRELLEIAESNSQGWKEFEDAVRIRFFENGTANQCNREKKANNTKLGMQAYGILDKDAHLTGFGKELYAVREDEDKLYLRLAKHILLNLNGMNVIQCLRDMQVAGVNITKADLRQWLIQRGIYSPPNGRHLNSLRQWLEKADILSDWRVNEGKLKELLALDADEVDELSGLNSQQRAFLKTVANLGPGKSGMSNDIASLAESVYGVKFREGNLPKDVLYPLQTKGYIDLERGTKSDGRGAKPFRVKPTDKLVSDIITPLLEQFDKVICADLRPYMRKPLDEIIKELGDSDKHIKGLALEALAIKLMQLLDLTYMSTRLRGDATGGAEVDVLFESTRLIYSRWQVQCKNTARVALDDVAKEVGLTHMLKSNVVVVIGTGKIGRIARQYANKIMQDSNLCIVLLDKDDVNSIVANPTVITDVFCREAEHAMTLKVLKPEDIPTDE